MLAGGEPAIEVQVGTPPNFERVRSLNCFKKMLIKSQQIGQLPLTGFAGFLKLFAGAVVGTVSEKRFAVRCQEPALCLEPKIEGFSSLTRG